MRQLRLKVDVLSLSATPIPRTPRCRCRAARHLRDRDAARGPAPGEDLRGRLRRRPRPKAIKRELARGGQAFFLHNRVETIDETAERVRALVPDARVAVAHGQMAEGRLEEVMLEFLRGDADVLVCTTIVESGLDIPSANTLIVERADELGLAQLYQIRGRVGARASAPTRTCSTRARPRCPRRPASGWPRSPTTRARLRLQDRHARPRDPRRRQPARRRAVGSRGGRRLRAVRGHDRRGRAPARAATPPRRPPSR